MLSDTPLPSCRNSSVHHSGVSQSRLRSMLEVACPLTGSHREY